MDKNNRNSDEKKSLLKRIKSISAKGSKNETFLQIENEKSNFKNAANKVKRKNLKFIHLVKRVIALNRMKKTGKNGQGNFIQVTNDVVVKEFGGWNKGKSKKRRFDMLNTELLESIEEDDFNWALKSLEKGAYAEATCSDTGLTACHMCAFFGRDKILNELISRSVNVSRVDNIGRSPLEIAIWQGHTKCVDALLSITDPQELTLSDKWKDSIYHDCAGLKNKTSEIWSNTTALHIASARLQVECVRSLLAADHSPILNNYEGMTPLDVCGKAYLGDLTAITEQRFFETIREFVTYAKINQVENDIHNTMKISNTGKMSTTPFHIAVLLDSKHSIQLLIDINAYPGCQNNDKQTPLHSAVANKKIKSLIALTSVCFHSHISILDLLNKDKHTALHMAVHSLWMKGVSILLEAGADVLAATGEKNTVLHIAAQTGHVALLKEFIKNIPNKNESINCKNSEGLTPLYTAITHSQMPCLQLLLSEGASCSVTLENEINVLHLAAQIGNTSILSMLLFEKNNDILINRQDLKSKMTPLHFACLNNYLECVTVLCDAGADMKIKAFKDTTPLHLAARKGHVDIIKFLLSKNSALMFERDEFGWLPFHSSTYAGHRKCIDLFLEHGADFSEVISDQNNKSKTVLATLTSNMQRSVEYLDELFDNYMKINTYHLEELDCEITIDYSILMPHRNKNARVDRFESMYVVKALARTSNKYGVNKLVIHPLIESFLYLQWKALRRFFFCILFTYGFFVIALTISVIDIYKYEQVMEKPPMIYHKLVWNLFLWISIAAIFFLEALYVISKKCMYLYNYEVWVKLLSLGLALAVSLINHKVDNHWSRYITAGAILLAWLEMIILLSRFPQFGYFYQMFSTVAMRAIKVLALFGSFMIIGFSLAFWVLFDSATPFEGPWKSIMKTIVMMTSEFDYSDIASVEGWEQYPSFPQILFIVFLISVPIVVMNLLLALAVSDTKDLETEGKIRRLTQQVDFLSTLDNLVHVVAWKYVPPFIKRYMDSWEVPLQVKIMPGQPKLLNENLFSESIITLICQRASKKRKDEDHQQKTMAFVSQMNDVQKMLKILLKNTEKDKKKPKSN